MNDFDKLAELRASADLASWASAGVHRCIQGHITTEPGNAEPIDCSTCGSISLLTFPEDTDGPLP